MKARRHEEIFEECLSALLEGRRSIEQSLSLYPSLAEHLEPLLRTAADVHAGYQQPPPPDYVREQARRRFLASADDRTHLHGLNPPGRWDAARWPKRRWIRLSGTLAAAVAVTLVLAGMALSRARESDAPSAPMVTLANLRATHNGLKNSASRGAPITSDNLRQLAETTTQLAAEVENPAAVEGLDQAVQEQFLLLRAIIDTQPASVEPEAIQALDLTERLAGRWGIGLPLISPTATRTPSATPAPTASPTQTPGGTPTPSGRTGAPTP